MVTVPACRLVLAACCACALGGCAGSYRLDDQRSVENPARDLLRLRWQRQLASHDIFDWRPQEWASAAYKADGTLFIGSSGKRFLAFDSAGRPLWSVRTEGAISSKPRYDEASNTVYFGADDGKVYAVDASTGKVRWRYATQGTMSHAPVLWEGLVLVSSSENRIYAIDAASGRWRWQYEREAPDGFTIQGYAGVLVHKGVAYTGFNDGVVVALRAATGEVLWTRNISGTKTRYVDADATPVLCGDAVLSASYASGLYALAPDTGSVRWHFPVEGASEVAVAGKRIYVTAPKVGLIALDLLGRELWRQSMPKGVPSRPVVAGNYVLVTGTESGLFVARARDGELLQYFDPGHGISGAPAVGPSSRGGSRTVTVVSNLGRLFYFTLR